MIDRDLPSFSGPAEAEAASREAVIAQIRRDFGAITVRCRPRVLAVCRKIVGDEQRAQELTQDAFVVALEKLDSFEARSDIGTWLCGIGRLTALGAVRKKDTVLADDGVLDPSDPAASTLAALTRGEREELIRQAAASCLGAQEQEIAWLRYVECLPRERIGAILEIGDAEAVRVQLQRITRRLQKAVRERLAQLGHGTSFLHTTW